MRDYRVKIKESHRPDAVTKRNQFHFLIKSHGWNLTNHVLLLLPADLHVLEGVFFFHLLRFTSEEMNGGDENLPQVVSGSLVSLLLCDL